SIQRAQLFNLIDPRTETDPQARSIGHWIVHHPFKRLWSRAMTESVVLQHLNELRPDRADFETSLLDTTLYDSAREFLSRPSKGRRSRLIGASYLLAGGNGRLPQAAVDMIELLHTGSLIVDDIQDGAETRRGGRSLHKLIGMPRALNTGNWLYFVALTRLD